MEKLTKTYNDLIKINRALTTSIERYRKALSDKTVDLETREERRDSVIKRFELAYDLLWKCLREYMIIIHGTSVDSPRKVFQKCLSLGITNKEENAQLIDLIKDRNLTTRIYDIESANQVASDIQKHHDVITTIIKKVSYDIIKK